MNAPAPDGAEILDALFRGATDAIVVTDARGEILQVSESVHSQLGWNPRELAGMNVRVLVPTPHGERHDEYMRRYRETGHTWILGTTREFDVLRQDGTLVPCELSISRIDPPSGHGEPYFCGIFRNIAERRAVRRALARSEGKFRAVFENENQLVLLLDETGRVVDANRRTYGRTSIAPTDVLGQRLEELRLWGSSANNRALVARTLARAYESGVATTRATLELLLPMDDFSAHSGARDMRLVPAVHEVSIRLLDEPQTGDSPMHAIVELRDISGTVLVEERERAVQRSLATIGEEAAVLAHELRHPVSELELALKAVARSLGENDRAILDSLAGRMRRLETLLSRTLSFSRPLEPRPQSIRPDAAFGRVLDRERAALARAGVRALVKVQPETPALSADPTALDDLLSNLVRNASEAQSEKGGAGGVVRLEAEPGPRGRVLLSIEDEGPGIPRDRREDVFRIFHSDKEGGTGIGLALVKKIAVAHDATVELHDGRDGRGLRVVLHWPSYASDRR